MSTLLEDLERVGVIKRNGHFVLKSWLHTRGYVNKDGAYPHPALVSRITWEMSQRAPRGTRAVIGPVVGGVILSTWTTHFLQRDRGGSVLSAFADKKGENDFELRRGYNLLVAGECCFAVEDVVTTGGSLKKTIDAIRFCGGNVVGAVALCNRGRISAEFLGVPEFTSLTNQEIETWTEEECMKNGPCSEGVPINTSVGHGAAYLRRKAAEQT